VPYLLNLLYLLLLLAALPRLLWQAIRKGKYREGYAAKFLGLVPRRTSAGSGKTCVWLHAVSVGEVNLLAPLLAEIERQRPDWECVISTTTMTGYALARKKYAPRTGARAGRVGTVAQPDPRGQAARGPGRGGQRAPEREQLPRLPAGPLAGVGTVAADRPVGRAGRDVRRAVPRAGGTAGAGPRDRLDEVRRGPNRPRQPRNPPARRAGRLRPPRRDLPGRQHAGAGRSRGVGGFSAAEGRMAGVEARDRPPPPRPLRGRCPADRPVGAALDAAQRARS